MLRRLAIGKPGKSHSTYPSISHLQLSQYISNLEWLDLRFQISNLIPHCLSTRYYAGRSINSTPANPFAIVRLYLFVLGYLCFLWMGAFVWIWKFESRQIDTCWDVGIWLYQISKHICCCIDEPSNSDYWWLILDYWFAKWTIKMSRYCPPAFGHPWFVLSRDLDKTTRNWEALRPFWKLTGPLSDTFCANGPKWDRLMAHGQGGPPPFMSHEPQAMGHERLITDYLKD